MSDSRYEIRQAQEDSVEDSRALIPAWNQDKKLIPELSSLPWPSYCHVCAGPCVEPAVMYPEGDIFYGLPRYLWGA